MTVNAANIEGAITGAAYQGLVGAALPTDPVTAWPSTGWTDMGYIDDNGVTESFDDSTSDVVSWQNHLLVRRFISKSVKSYKFGMLESKGSVMNTFFKGVTITESSVGSSPATNFWEFTEYSPNSLITPWGFDVIDGSVHERLVIPTAEVTTRGEISYKADGAKVYTVTLTAYPIAGGIVAYRYSTNAAWGQS